MRALCASAASGVLISLLAAGSVEAAAQADGLMTVTLSWRSPVTNSGTGYLPCDASSDVFCVFGEGNQTFRYSINNDTRLINSSGPAVADGIAVSAANDITQDLQVFATGTTMTYQFYANATNNEGPFSTALGRSDIRNQPLAYISQPGYGVTTPSPFPNYSQLQISYNFAWGDFDKSTEKFDPRYNGQDNAADLSSVPGLYSDAVTTGYFSICVNDVLTLNSSCTETVNGVVHKGTIFGFDGGGGGRNIDFADPRWRATDSLTSTIDLQPWANYKTIYISAIHIGVSALGFTAVPEPRSWALMLTGFGAAGSLLRRRRKRRILAE